MKKIRLLIIMSYLFMPQPSLSEVIIKSTSHSNFDRLIIYLQEGQDWVIQEKKDSYTLLISNPILDFNTENIFENISRSRIQSVYEDQGALNIELACNCRLISNQLASGQLVLDIFGLASTSLAPELFLPNISSSNLRPLRAASTTEEVRLETRDLRRRILKDLGNSISLSILEKTDGPIQSSREAKQLEPSVFDQLHASKRIHLYNSIQLAKDINLRNDTSRESEQCPDPQIFRISNWSKDKGFNEKISQLRSLLFTELDVLDEEVGADLVRAYLYYALTEEAEALLLILGVETLEEMYLNELISIMKEVEKRDESLLFTLSNCTGSIVPWLVLSSPMKSDLSSEQRKSLVLEVSSWPSSVLELLGPRLYFILQERGYATTASIVDGILKGIEAEVLAPNIRLSELSTAELYQISKDGNQRSAEALTIFIERSIKQFTPISEKDIELAKAYEFELRGLPISDMLLEQRLMAYAYTGEYVELLKLLNRLQRDRNPVVSKKIEDIVALSIGLQHTLQTILVSNFIVKEKLKSMISIGTSNLIIDILLDADLSSLSKKFIRKDEAENQISSYSPRIAVSEYNTALLEGIDYTKVNQGVLVLASKYLLNTGNADQLPSKIVETLPRYLQDRISFSQKNWAQVKNSDLEGRFAKAISSSLEKASDDTPLANARELIRDSSDGRQVVEDALLTPAR